MRLITDVWGRALTTLEEAISSYGAKQYFYVQLRIFSDDIGQDLYFLSDVHADLETFLKAQPISRFVVYQEDQENILEGLCNIQPLGAESFNDVDELYQLSFGPGRWIGNCRIAMLSSKALVKLLPMISLEFGSAAHRRE